MAQDQSPVPAPAPWTKIFTAFKVALDLKKLLLAATGIFLVWIGWWVLAVTFSWLRGPAPEWKNIENKERRDERSAQWSYFKSKRASWNLLHELAGSPSDHAKVDVGDLAENPDEYELLHKWEDAYRRLDKPIILKDKALKVPDISLDLVLTPIGADGEAAFALLKDKPLKVGSIVIPLSAIPDVKDKEAVRFVFLDGVKVKVEGPFEKLKDYREGALNLAQVADSARREKNEKVAMQALKVFQMFFVQPVYKASGLLRIDPWSEDRGGNPYLIVADTLKPPVNAINSSGNVLQWLFSQKSLVLVEPLVKFLAPLVYLFDARAGFMDRLYLLLVVLWTLAVWGFFGGAICRIAAVQLARNERISLREAISFTRDRFTSFLAAPAFPLALLAIFAFVLVIFGWVVWIPWLGETVGGLLWPVVILIGLMMTVVMVGLVGWPIMIATISTEGTDSFDALSRSYSYIFQAPWQYLWYSFLAVVYGAALVFFIGFMASLMVFLGKWGVSSAPGLASADAGSDREPSYLFQYAPTSYGWRDLLISGNTPFVEKKKFTAPSGQEVERLSFKAEYESKISGTNSFGAFLVSIWIYPLFLLVVGFGYSYFWSASTIIYFLMRRHVDDTPMDEVHQEDDDLEDPFLKTTPPPTPPPPPTNKPGTLSLNVVEAPPPAPPAPPLTPYAVDEHPSPPVSSPTETPPPPPAQPS